MDIIIITNEALWIFTVAASTIDRDFQAKVILGDNTTIQGGAIHFGELEKTPVQCTHCRASSLQSPSPASRKVMPNKLVFTKDQKKLAYKVTFAASSSAPKQDTFGSITWTNNGKYRVRSPIVVSVE